MPNEGRRNTALDALRGIAILLVLGSHAVYRPLKPILSLEPLARFWRDVGWTGVDLFFVLSGYLVSSLLLREVRAVRRLRSRQQPSWAAQVAEQRPTAQRLRVRHNID